MSNSKGNPTTIFALGVICTLVVAAAITKPSEDQFTEWYQQHLDSKVPPTSGVASSILEQAKAKVLGVQGQFTVQYEDKVIFAKATVSQGDRTPEFLGIYGTWIQVSTE